MKNYETTIVIDSFQKSEEMQNIVTKIQNFITNNGGEIQKIDDWGKKRLAYEINRKQYGNYHQIHFTSAETLPKLLEKEYKLEESILRHLTLISNPKAIPEKKEAEEIQQPQAEAVVDKTLGTATTEEAVLEDSEPAEQKSELPAVE